MTAWPAPCAPPTPSATVIQSLPPPAWGPAIAAPVDLAGSLAADALAAAIRHGVRSAQSDYGIAAVADLGGPT